MAPKRSPQARAKAPTLKTKVTRAPYVPSRSQSRNPRTAVDMAKKCVMHDMDTPKGKLLEAIRALADEVFDRREEQLKIQKFMLQLQRLTVNSSIYTVAKAAELARIKRVKPLDASTSTKPTALGRLRKLTKSPPKMAAVDAAVGPSLSNSEDMMGSDSFGPDSESDTDLPARRAR